MKKILIPALLLLFVVFAYAAIQIDGSWKGYVEGQYNLTATFKTDGSNLSGTLVLVDNNPKSENPDDVSYSPFVSAQMGKNEIKDGKIEGDNITFTTMFNETPIVYKGIIQSEKIVLTANFKNQVVKSTLSRVK